MSKVAKQDKDDGNAKAYKPGEVKGQGAKRPGAYSCRKRKIQSPAKRGTISKAAIKKAVKEVIAEHAARS